MKILVIDDEKDIRDVLKRLLEPKNCKVTLCENVAETRKAVKEHGPFHAALVDLMLPDGDGEDCIKAIRRQSKDTEIIVITALMDEERLDRLKHLKKVKVLTKPINFSYLELLLRL